MNHIVMKLMDYAEGYARAHTYSTSNDRHVARKILEAELIRLLTPLSDEQIQETAFGCGGVPTPHLMFAREIEALHGIGDSK